MKKTKKNVVVISKILFGACICLTLWAWNATSVQAFESGDSFLCVNGTYMVDCGELKKTTVNGDRGTATYDKVANTLILKNFISTFSQPIVAQDMSGLKIVLEGANELKSNYTGIGITQRGKLTICGTGTLKITAGTKKLWGNGIFVNRNLVVDGQTDLDVKNCTLNIVASANPIIATDKISIENANITVRRIGVDGENSPRTTKTDFNNANISYSGLSATTLAVSASELDISGFNHALDTSEKPALDSDMTVTDEHGAKLNLVKFKWPCLQTLYPDSTTSWYVYSKSTAERIYSFDDAVNRVIIRNKPKAEKPTVPGTPSKPDSPQKPSALDIGKVTGKYKSGNLYYSGKLASGKLSCVGMVNRKASSISIPSTVKIKGYTCKVTSIGKKAFKNCTSLKSARIGNNITSIGAEAFSSCTRLKSLAFGKNVKTISDKAFYKCTALTKVSLPSRTGTIKTAAFANCISLKTVKTGNGVSGIGNQAFYNCKKLTSLSLGKNVSTISDRAFYKCARLTKVTFPSKVRYIKKNAFASCSRLKTITFQGKSLKGVGTTAFRNTGNKIRVNVPKSKYSSYKRILKGKGLRNPVYKKR